MAAAAVALVQPRRHGIAGRGGAAARGRRLGVAGARLQRGAGARAPAAQLVYCWARVQRVAGLVHVAAAAAVRRLLWPRTTLLLV